MKKLLLASTLLIGSAAFAQMPVAENPAKPVMGETLDQPGALPPPATTSSATAPTYEAKPAPAAGDNQPVGDEYDGMGGPDTADEWNVSRSAAAPGPAMAQRLDTYRVVTRDSYPICSHGVTDNCVQRNDPGGN